MFSRSLDGTDERNLGLRFGAPYRIFRLPKCSFSIECSSALLEQIRREVDYGLYFPRRERESGGVLFGRTEPDRIQIVAYRPLHCEHAMGPGFVLSQNDEKSLVELISSSRTHCELNELQALGWYHSHIYGKVSLSERDLQIHSRFFAAPFQVALVLRLSSERATRAGWFF